MTKPKRYIVERCYGGDGWKARVCRTLDKWGLGYLAILLSTYVFPKEPSLYDERGNLKPGVKGPGPEWEKQS